MGSMFTGNKHLLNIQCMYGEGRLDLHPLGTHVAMRQDRHEMVREYLQSNVEEIVTDYKLA